MKRSEMLGIIKDQLHKYVGCHMTFEEVFNLLPNDILTEIEKHMTPPSYTGCIANGEKYDKDKHWARDVALFTEWEPENEEST